MRVRNFLTAAALTLAPLSAFAQQAPVLFGDNILINPWMEIDQVNEGATVAATVATSGTYTIVKSGDGWYAINSNNSTGSPTVTFQNSAGPYNNGAAFDAKYTTGTAGTAGASDLLTVFQPIEPSRMAQLQYGTANAQGSYLSFCAQSSVAGTYSFAIVPNLLSGISATSNSIATYYQQFTLNGAAAPQCMQFYVPPATVGTWGLTTNTVDSTHGGNLLFVLGVGTNLGGATLCTPLNGAWMLSASSKNCLGVSTQNALNIKTAATFEVTGVKWSLNPTPLVHNPGLELLEAERYFAKTFKVGTGGVAGVKPATNFGVGTGNWVETEAWVASKVVDIYWPFPQPMRASPTITTFDPAAADSKCADLTNAAQATVLVEPDTTSHAIGNVGVTIQCASTAWTAGDSIVVGITADARL